MFDFSLPELMAIMVVALTVIGPERLPKVARTLGHLWGRAQRYVNGVKADIERDMSIEEFRQMQQKVEAEAGAVTKSLRQVTNSVDQQVQDINKEVSEPESHSQATQSVQADQQAQQSVVHPSAISSPANKPE